ncbi:Peptidoglycan/LPS O-acetylase OafA/YrhL, contains acyltransferase and SGNH-hydrolase domains [Bradyrhizobium lablabi]|uniref:Peptidoglycan/LPS O-acetylase OafA/YrhL, contains acyltransferase and SGNH-hydrolase domains n=1 Tax=Bradyrhizobium lablabi TaxID=722472 RepID=A0A1M7CCN8_9BRAD|nr:acyltransferase family protein [Bradyrhizobium lablabi]SHL64906.1 Peptidoglycan/LPS O-acetylase OafA/YrhL, contains acyltransferase and SGNH-hydrolase domains [Bradyrhizobium lablabi]
MRRDYREDIDWLRAIAVLAVVAFHFEAPAVYGGFVGVDIFFVISGYLITGIIQSEVKSGTFSFAQFYERRVRRLLPALYAMVVLTAIPSFHYLLTSERQEFFRSVAAVVTFTSNFFFWFQTGYFEHAAVEKPLLHTWSLAVEEQFYLALPLSLWALLRFVGGRRVVPAALGVLSLASFALCIWLMRTDRSADAFFMSPPRAWEFLIGGIVAIPGFPVLRHALAQAVARATALVLIAIPIFSLRQGPGFPGFNALTPCIGAAMFTWSGIGVPTLKRSRYSPFNVARFFGQISYSLYLWHWPLFTFARFSKAGLVLGATDKVALFALTVLISSLSWRFVEQPFRLKGLAPTRGFMFRIAGLATLVLLAGSALGIVASQRPSEADRVALQLESFNAYDYQPLYRFGSCFAPASGVLDEVCLAFAPDKTNLLLWGDSLAAHYFHGLGKTTDPRLTKTLQATQAACMPTFNAAAQGNAWCRGFAGQMDAFFADHKPALVILSADWLEYSRPPRFDGMIADLKQTIAKLNERGVPVVLLGPAVQFRSRLPSMLMRAHLRQVDARPDDFVLPEIFDLDRNMKAALPAHEGFSYISVVDVICPARQCPLTLDGGIPLAWDHAHLTAEGSVYVVSRLALKRVIPGQPAGLNPESRDSGSTLTRVPE